jgi:hypothetical protein
MKWVSVAVFARGVALKNQKSLEKQQSLYTYAF